MAKGDQFWLRKLVRLDRFWKQKWSGGPVLAKVAAKIGPARPTLGRTDFGVTEPSFVLTRTTESNTNQL